MSSYLNNIGACSRRLQRYQKLGYGRREQAPALRCSQRCIYVLEQIPMMQASPQGMKMGHGAHFKPSPLRGRWRAAPDEVYSYEYLIGYYHLISRLRRQLPLKGKPLYALHPHRIFRAVLKNQIGRLIDNRATDSVVCPAWEITRR